MASATDTMKQIVLAAFSDEPVPRQLFWEHAEPTWEFPEDFERIFGGKPWTDMSELDWRMCCLGNAFRGCLKPSTSLYYLPTLFLEAIDGGDIEVAVEAILPNNARRIPKGAWWAEFFASRSSEQRSAIASFLAYLRPGRSEEVDAGMFDVTLSAAEVIWRNQEGGA